MTDEEGKSEILAEIQALQLDFEELKKVLEQQYPKYHSLKYQSIQTSVEELQKKLVAKKYFWNILSQIVVPSYFRSARIL